VIISEVAPSLKAAKILSRASRRHARSFGQGPVSGDVVMTGTATKRALLAWQIGDGRGHISKLRNIGKVLCARGVDCSAALTRLEHAHELRDVASSIRPVPPLPYLHHLRIRRGEQPASTYGEFLGDLGFASPGIIAEHVGIWRRLIDAERPNCVIAEQAPSAVLAARSLGIPVAALGTTYTLPPTTLKNFPPLLGEYHQRKWSETDMCDAINSVIAPLGVPPLSCLSEIYRADVALPVGIRILDPYAPLRIEPRLPPNAPNTSARNIDRTDRREVFVYLSAGFRPSPSILAAFRRLPVPLRVYMANADATVAVHLRRLGAAVEHEPVSPRDIARRSRLMFHSGNMGTMCLGIRAGIPQIAVPQQLEQMYHARRLEATGAGVTIGWHERADAIYEDRILSLYESARAHDSALRLAEHTEHEFQGEAGEIGAEKIMELMT
jgi:hypothetical protein